MMPLQPNNPAPYTSTAALTTVMDAYRDRGLGVPITQDVLIRAGVPETLGGRTLQSMKLLELINEDGRPSQQFEDFRVIRGDDEYRERLQEWLRGLYADVLQYCDPSTDAQQKVIEAFRTYEPQGQRRGMALLLIGLWKYSGLPVPEAPPNGVERKPPSPARKRPPSSKASPQEPKSDTASGAASPVSTAVQVQVADLPPALVGLLQQIPRDGGGWTQSKRDQFMTIFGMALDWTIPTQESDEFPSFAEDDGDDEEDEP